MPTSESTPIPQRIALITGGSRGLGRAAALSLAAKGIDVVFTYHANRAAADEVVAATAALGRKAVALQLDTGNVAAFSAFAVEFKRALAQTWTAERFDYLVNNAGIGKRAAFAETTEADFDELVKVNLKGVFFLTQTLLPLIADGGRIINLSSGLTRFSYAGMSAYAATKGALEVLTRYLAVELGARGITVNSVAPGAIETDFAGGGVRDNVQANQFIASVTALGRAGLPEDIGPMIAALLSDDNRWVNAQRIEVSGGQML
jgi:NAD(P)-dependent dehydrogenase (short-subunit alcohol dehydrogenase family)